MPAPSVNRVRPAALLLEDRDNPSTFSTFFTDQHIDLNLGFAAGDWTLGVRNNDVIPNVTTAPGDAILYAGTNAKLARPAGGEFDFLGVGAGSDVWVLPGTQEANKLYLGFAAEGVGPTAVDRYDATAESGGRVTGQGRWVRVSFTNVAHTNPDGTAGTGDFSVWQVPVSTPVVFAATSDGLTAADSIWLIAGGHTHYNLGFSAAGRYEVTFRASAFQENGNDSTAGTPFATEDFTVVFSVESVGRFSFNPSTPTVVEGDTATVTVVRTGGSDGRITVNYATSNGTAESGDYTSASGTLTFEDGETSKTFTVSTNQDGDADDETVTLTLSSPGPSSIAGFATGLPGGSLIQTATGTLTIQDDEDADRPTITPIEDFSLNEDTASSAIDFTIGDNAGVGGLTVTRTSSNTTLVPLANVVLGGTGASRNVTVTPAANQFGQTTITITVTDAGGKSVSESFVVTVLSVPDLPSAENDAFGVTPGNVLRGNVLFNDAENPDIGGGLTAALQTGPTKGTVVLNADGSFAYTPGAAFDGTDSLTYRAVGIDGSAVATVTITGRPTEPTFVGVLSEGEIDIEAEIIEGELEGVVHDVVNDVEYEPADTALLHARPGTATTRPAGAAFDFIGVPAGQPIWVVPQNEQAGLLYLALASEDIDGADVEPNEVRFRLKSVDGPGFFSVWEVDGFGNPTAYFTSADGVTTGDEFVSLLGHSHMNFGFTARGLYAVTLQAFATAAGGDPLVSEEFTVYFAVDPQNAAPVVSGPATTRVDNTGTLGFTGANAVTVADTEGTGGQYTAVVTATNGVVSLTGAGGAGVSVTITGTLAAVNAALAGLTFTPTAGFIGAASVTVEVTDPGFLVGAENAQTGTLTIPVDVRPGVVRDRFAVGAGAGATAAVRTLAGSDALTVTPFGAGFTGGVRVASADVTGDGVLDLIAGAGPGGSPTVVVFDGASGKEVARFDAFESGFTGGVYVAGADFDGDGRAEVVASADQGGGPVVAVFRVAGGTSAEVVRFMGIHDDAFRGGARIAVGDVTGDGTPDIVVSAGFLGGPRISIWDGSVIAAGQKPTTPIANFFAFEDTLRNGAFVAVGDVTGDGRADLIFGGGPGGGPRVRVIDGLQIMLAADVLTSLDDLLTGQVASFFAGPESDREGVRVSALDATGDGRPDVVTGSATRPTVAVFDLKTFDGTDPTDAFDPLGDILGGIFVG
jgi:surface-anchored protein